MESTHNHRFFNRGPSALVRLLFFGLLSLFLLFIDARFKQLESTRFALQILIYPVQRLTFLPSMAWQKIDVFFTLQNRLLTENSQLQQQHNLDAAKLQKLQVVEAENTHFRQLLEMRQNATYPMQITEIAYVERDLFKRKAIIDKGLANNVQAGQIVLDDIGVLGQITHVFAFAAEVTLITDKNHAVPVQILRNGLRAVTFGSGNISELSLRYMPLNADILVGDQLVTSGIDGTYPAGIPVAKITKVERDPAFPFARIACEPLAGVDKNRFLLIASFTPTLAARPSNDDAPEKSRQKNRRGLTR